MRISIIVPAYNEEKLIGRSLEEMRRASSAFLDRKWDLELVVCNNNSTDRTAEIAQAHGAKVVFEPINQIARARNTGAGAATGEWLIFIDADSHPSRSLFEEVADTIASGQYLAGGCTVQIDERHWIGNAATQLWNTISRLTRWAAGSFIFCQRNAFQEVGGFNLELFASEEIDLFKRFKKIARQRRKRIVILHRHPILTSARKLHLYSRGEHTRFLLQALFRPRRTVRQREACPTWYDGRR